MGGNGYSCVNKKNNVIDQDKYLDVLLSKRSVSGVNRGFRVLKIILCVHMVKLKTLLVIFIQNVRFWRTVCQQFL